MPALDFPSSPTNGQIYEQYTYDSTKGAWRVTANPGATVVSSPTPPTSPVSGNLWLNTNDGVLFVYYNDGDTSQWVEVKSNTASGSTVAARVDALELADASTNRSGLVPIKPTSVAVGSGSASVAESGLVTFTGSNSVSLNGVFTSTYRNYRASISIALATGSGGSLLFRLRNAGADRTDNNYQTMGTQGRSTNTISSFALNGGTYSDLGYMTVLNNSFTGGNIEIIEPQISLMTKISSTIVGVSSANDTGAWHLGSAHHVVQSHDGFTILTASSSLMTGTLKVYGYN